MDIEIVIVGIAVPVMAGLFWLIWKLHSANQKAIASLTKALTDAINTMTKDLTDLRIEVANARASNTYVKEVDDRLSRRIGKLEDHVFGGS